MRNYYPKRKPGKPALPGIMVLLVFCLTVLAVLILSATWILIRTWGGIAATWWVIMGILVWFKPLQRPSYVPIGHIFSLMLYLQQSVIFLAYLLFPTSLGLNIFFISAGNAILCFVYLFIVWLWSPRSRVSATIEEDNS